MVGDYVGTIFFLLSLNLASTANEIQIPTHVGGLTDLGPHGSEIVRDQEKILAGHWRDVGAIIHPISAPKMERASIFLHAASGFLKKYSPEAEKS